MFLVAQLDLAPVEATHKSDRTLACRTASRVEVPVVLATQQHKESSQRTLNSKIQNSMQFESATPAGGPATVSGRFQNSLLDS